MAIYKALKTFAGTVSMRKGTEKEIIDDAVAKDLITAGFVVAVDSSKPEKKSVDASPVESVEDEKPAPKKAGRKPKKEGA